ncbi:S-adenosyl-L-methionine-dependent methyltransferase [Mycena galopus ATCC 62051]|nr:S-adenosyl-L-methionine-dependent methyltransferase [Mycena galopus ATCC 62051]
MSSDDSELFALHDVYLNITLLQAFGNGAYFVIFFLALYAMVCKRRTHKLLFVVVILMYMFATIQTGLGTHGTSPDDTVNYLSQPTFTLIVLPATLLVANTFFADCVLDCGVSFVETSIASRKVALAYGRQLARALLALHERGIIHSDLKDDNLMLGSDGHLIEFPHWDSLRQEAFRIPGEGHFPLLWPGDDNPHCMRVLGGMDGYMSPEAERGDMCSYGSDLFAFGTLLDEWLVDAAISQGEQDPRSMTEIEKDFFTRITSSTYPVCFEGWKEILDHAIWDSRHRCWDSFVDVGCRDVVFTSMNQEASKYFKSLVSSPGFGKQRPIRVLEVGAGVGGLTKFLVEALCDMPNADVEYTVTDLSYSLASSLAESFTYKNMVAEIHYNIITGLNVIHAIPDLNATLRDLNTLLAPGGRLLVVDTDGTARSANPPRPGAIWNDFIWGSFQGWFGYTDDRAHCTIDEKQWRTCLAATGYSNIKVCHEDVGTCIMFEAEWA